MYVRMVHLCDEHQLNHPATASCGISHETLTSIMLKAFKNITYNEI